MLLIILLICQCTQISSFINLCSILYIRQLKYEQYAPAVLYRILQLIFYNLFGSLYKIKGLTTWNVCFGLAQSINIPILFQQCSIYKMLYYQVKQNKLDLESQGPCIFSHMWKLEGKRKRGKDLMKTEGKPVEWRTMTRGGKRSGKGHILENKN